MFFTSTPEGVEHDRLLRGGFHCFLQPPYEGCGGSVAEWRHKDGRLCHRWTMSTDKTITPHTREGSPRTTSRGKNALEALWCRSELPNSKVTRHPFFMNEVAR